MAISGTNTVPEALNKILTMVASAKALPDAPSFMEDLINIETAVLGVLHKPVDQMAQQGMTNIPPPAGGHGFAPRGPGGPVPPGMNAMPGGPMPPELAAMMQQG